MGINLSAIKVFLHETQRLAFHGRLLTLGRQDVFVTQPEMLNAFAEFKRKPAREVSPQLSRKESFSEHGFISDDYLFSALGFSECKALDASTYEDADYVFDLNKPNPPDDLLNQWDVVFDGGTVEHVFNIPNAFANIFSLLRVGGRIIHIAPSSNHIDHGFYMFSPTLFWDYYNANSFDVNICQVFRYTRNLYAGAWEVCDYVPGGLIRVSMGGLDDALYGVIFIATKRPDSTCDVVPQQGKYLSGLWKQRTGSEITRSVEDLIEPNFSGQGLGLRVKYRL